MIKRAACFVTWAGCVAAAAADAPAFTTVQPVKRASGRVRLLVVKED